MMLSLDVDLKNVLSDNRLRSRRPTSAVSAPHITEDGEDEEASVRVQVEHDSDYKEKKKNRATTSRGRKVGLPQVRMELAQAQATIKGLRKENERMETLMAGLRADFTEAEHHMREQIKQRVYHELPDNIVKEQFRELMMVCTGWVKDWTAGELSGITDEILRVELRGLLPNPSESLLGLLFTEARREERRFCRIILLAKLVTALTEHLFTTPFKTWSTLKLGSVPKNFDEVYRLFEKDLPQEAQAWRVATMRLLETRLNSASTSTSFADLLSSRCRSLIQSNFDQYTEKYLKSRNEGQHIKCQAELQSIYEMAARLSIRLWSRESKVHICRGGKIFERPFFIASDIYQPHASMGLEDSDVCHDGKLVHLVITPLVVSAPGHDTRLDLNTAKIWHRAVVLICEEIELPAAMSHVDFEKEYQTSPKRCPEDSASNGPQVKRRKIEERVASKNPLTNASDRACDLVRAQDCNVASSASRPQNPPRSSIISVMQHAGTASSHQQDRVAEEPAALSPDELAMSYTEDSVESRRSQRSESVDFPGSPGNATARNGSLSGEGIYQRDPSAEHEYSSESSLSLETIGKNKECNPEQSHDSSQEQIGPETVAEQVSDRPEAAQFVTPTARSQSQQESRDTLSATPRKSQQVLRFDKNRRRLFYKPPGIRSSDPSGVDERHNK